MQESGFNHQYYNMRWINEMNTKNNQRSRNTDEVIIRTTFGIMVEKNKPVSKITVREICDKAQINRSTFYAHYLDVYDVVDKVERTMSEELTKSFIQELDEGKDMASCFEALFAFVRKHKAFYRLYFNTTGRSKAIGIAWDLLHNRTDALSYKELGYLSEEELKYHGEFFITGMSAMLHRWVERECPETPRELFDILKRHYTPQAHMFF